MPESGGTPEQDADLEMMVTKWVADSAKIVTSLRTTCGGAASGASKFKDFHLPTGEAATSEM